MYSLLASQRRSDSALVIFSPTYPMTCAPAGMSVRANPPRRSMADPRKSTNDAAPGIAIPEAEFSARFSMLPSVHLKVLECRIQTRPQNDPPERGFQPA